MKKNKCPLCDGNGIILKDIDGKEVTIDGKRLYQDTTCPKVITFYEPCPLCNTRKVDFRNARKVLSNMPKRFQGMSTKDFNSKIYTNEEGQTWDISNVMNLANNFVLRFNEVKKSLYIYSYESGTGKTMLASLLGNSLIEKYGLKVLFADCNFLIDNQKENPGLIDELCKCDMLILDDIGAKRNKWLDDILEKIFYVRENNGLKTIYTSNQDIEHLDIDKRTRERYLIGQICEIRLPDINIRQKMRANRE